MSDFETFFADEFQRRLEQTVVPGMADASWDRKAAWLLFVAERRPGPGTAHVSPKPPVLSGGLFD